MIKVIINISILLLFIHNPIFAQTNFKNKKQADSLYKAKQYALAGPAYLYVSNTTDFKIQKASSLYNAACCFALAKKSDSAFLILNQAIANGYNDKKNLLTDSDFEGIHNDKRWGSIIQAIGGKQQKQLNANPLNPKFHTEDIANFWIAYDKAQKDTTNAELMYKKYYFNKASDGMEDYMGAKVSSIHDFVIHYKQHPKFYVAIRQNTLKVDSMKAGFYKVFDNLKTIYPGALFPDVYFVMGAFTSGGTVSEKGLLIGINQAIKDSHTPLDELTIRQKSMLSDFNNIPSLIAHELIHFQQDHLKKDTTTLFYTIKEGMADFMGELISGNTANGHLHIWARGKEKQIWERFKTDMYFDRYDNWIANGKQETIDFPADQGYWVGYQICKAYYDQATDKKQAVYDMLHIQDYKLFLEKSKWEQKLGAI